MAKILVTDKLSSKSIAKLKGVHEVEEFLEWGPEDLLEKIKGFDALVIRSRTKATRELIESANNLKVIARAGAGLDNVDREAAKDNGIEVLNTPTANLLSVAELTLGLAIDLLRNVSRADKGIKEGKWEKKSLKGSEISGKTWGIIGFGHVGQLVAGLLSGFKSEILAYDPYVPKDVAVSYGAKLVSLEDLMKDSDIISIHVPLLDSTRGLIGAKELSLMKENAIIINISRGGIIDEKALYEVLKQDKIKGAALDVFEKEPPEGSPLLELQNTLFTCHLGAQTRDAQERVGEEITDKLLKALE
jgi:D-3-phosphoglycerate dehydrogenase